MDVRQIYETNLSYHTAYRAREHALHGVHGSPEESYYKLPHYCHMLKMKNKGSVTDIETDSQGRFEYLFIAISSSIRGFRTDIRPVIVVDTAHLKHTCKGVLFGVQCLDGNNQIFPIAFGVSDKKKDASWIWFFRKLKEAIGDIRDLVVISDRKTSIEKAVHLVFPDALYGIYNTYLESNVTLRFGNNKKMSSLLYLASRSYTVHEFNYYMSLIEGEKPRVARYIEAIGVQKWVRSSFDSRRYSIMTTNIAESINGRFLKDRGLPIIAMIESIRETLQNWFFDRREKAKAQTTYLTKYANKVMMERTEEGRTCRLSPVDHNIVNIIESDQECLVDMSMKTCTCKVWQTDKFPCTHALVAFHRRIDIKDLCSPYYANDSLFHAYAENIYPLRNKDDWVLPPEVKNHVVHPPKDTTNAGRPKGRPREKRIPSRGEFKRTAKCSCCKRYGHYRSNCPNLKNNG